LRWSRPLRDPTPNIHLVRWGVDNSDTTTREGGLPGGLTELETYVGRSIEHRCDDRVYSAIELKCCATTITRQRSTASICTTGVSEYRRAHS
jgi:hypothetical protein